MTTTLVALAPDCCYPNISVLKRLTNTAMQQFALVTPQAYTGNVQRQKVTPLRRLWIPRSRRFPRLSPCVDFERRGFH